MGEPKERIRFFCFNSSLYFSLKAYKSIRMSLPRIVVVGGHGKASPLLFSLFLVPLRADVSKSLPQVALHFARLASPSYSVTSLVRSEDHFQDIKQTGATPKLLSLEDASVDELKNAFDGAKGVLFAAGAGGKGGKERTKKVDEEGAIKVSHLFEIRAIRMYN